MEKSVATMIFHCGIGIAAMVAGIFFTFFKFEFPFPFQGLVGLILFGLGFMMIIQGMVKSIKLVNE
jgi:putative Mn2+ efflux pump MntP